jgi:hypothetical protein
MYTKYSYARTSSTTASTASRKSAAVAAARSAGCQAALLQAEGPSVPGAEAPLFQSARFVPERLGLGRDGLRRLAAASSVTLCPWRQGTWVRGLYAYVPCA